DAGKWKAKQAEGDLVVSTTVVDANTKPDINVQKKGNGSDGGGTTESILMIVGLCAVGFIILKMRKKKKK
ncbi:MAG: LPXTG cell wall anchor domain-containing protein, partial [Bacteriovorax sp.]|nr:LPXTG cell wall anchor domain-containing protein [Bacteriovorax sp.]